MRNDCSPGPCSGKVSYVTYALHIGYNMNVMRHSVCLLVNPITVNTFTYRLNCIPAGRASDSMMGPTCSLLIYLNWLGLD